MCSRSVRTRPASCMCSRQAAVSTGSLPRLKPSRPEQHLNGNRLLEVAMHIRLRSLALAALACALVAAPAPAFGLKGPPWISIELPANPYDKSTRDAFLHGTAMGFIVTGTAEGMVNGERRSLKLDFAETSREGVFALKRTWPREGTWTLVIKANQGPEDAATAVVDLGPDGEVATIRVPTMQRGSWTVPAPVSLEEIDGALRARAATLARRS